MTRRAARLPIDHIGLAGRDIRAMLGAYEALGFSVTPRQPLLGINEAGDTVALGQTSAHIMFPETYIELTAVETAAHDNHLNPYLARYEGLHILALAVDDAETCQNTLNAKGIKTGSVSRAARDVVYGTPGQAQFKWFVLEPETYNEGLVCCVEHVTPDVVFQIDVMAHPNGAVGVTSVFASPVDLDIAIERYKNLGAVLGSSHKIEIWNYDSFDELGLSGQRQPVPCLQGLAVKVQSLATLRGTLDRNAVAPARDDRTAIWIEPKDAAGALLKFHE